MVADSKATVDLEAVADSEVAALREIIALEADLATDQEEIPAADLLVHSAPTDFVVKVHIL